MLYRLAVLAAALVLTAGSSLWAEQPGERELALGREAMIRHDYAGAVEHLTAAVRALDQGAGREISAEAWLQLGQAQMIGLGQAEEALEAFEKSAGLAANPASAWLWASVAAEKLGRWEEAGLYKTRALAPRAMSVPLSAAEPLRPLEVPAAPPPVPPAAPEPEKKPEPEEKQEEPSAFQHFFGPKEPAPEEQAKPEEKPEEKKAEPKKKADAFQHFFGEKENKDETKEQPEPEKPPL